MPEIPPSVIEALAQVATKWSRLQTVCYNQGNLGREEEEEEEALFLESRKSNSVKGFSSYVLLFRWLGWSRCDMDVQFAWSGWRFWDGNPEIEQRAHAIHMSSIPPACCFLLPTSTTELPFHPLVELPICPIRGRSGGD